MNPDNSIQPESLSGHGKRLLNLIELDENEVLIDEIRKHPFGLFVIYITGFSIGFVLFLVLFVLPSFLKTEEFGVDIKNYTPILMVIGFFVLIFCLIGTLIGAYLYKHDVIVVTSEKIAQVMYINIFNRKISQLSIGEVQDVTVTQEGILPRIFNYGTIVVETAGEQNNYMFTYVPDPYTRSKKIVGSHEKSIEHYGN